jgi:hypothetical protein
VSRWFGARQASLLATGCWLLAAEQSMITLQSIITLAYYALTAGAAALLVCNFVKAKSWEREVLYLIVLVPFLLRVLRLK